MKYRIKEIKKNIFAVIIPKNYERAMIFCRIQEFYESPKFRNKKFSIWDYFKWYSLKFGEGCFSYPKDYVGFNLPLFVAKKCYEINEPETPYDLEMIKIINSIYKNGEKRYLIGVDSIKNSTFKHEMAHAFYYTNIEYKKKMNKITNELSNSDFNKFKKNIIKMGYCTKVIKDEIQAYMSTEINNKVAKGISQKRKIHNKFKSILKMYI